MISYGKNGHWALGRNKETQFGFVGDEEYQNEKVISFASQHYSTIMNTFTDDSPILLNVFGYNDN